MRLQCLLLLSLLAVCFLLACCAPQGAASLKRSALLALESHMQGLASPRELPEAADDAEPESCAQSAQETSSSLTNGGSSKARPPAAALRRRITPYQSRKIAARQQFPPSEGCDS